MIPMKSPVGKLLNNKRENPNKTHGRYGAVKTNRPKKLTRTSGFFCDHRYTSINVRGEPKKIRPVTGPIIYVVTCTDNAYQ